ncbi:MAG: DnaJ domain-containing protein [Azospirillaceae bacterium]
MIQAFLLGAGLLVALLIGGFWFANSEPRQVIRVGRIVGALVLIGIAGLLLISGRLPMALAALAFALPMLMRLRALRNYARSAFGPARGQRSALRTRYLDVSLDHDTGEMDGYVTDGPFEGRRLSEMDLEALRELGRAIEEDPQSAQILLAYLQRRFGAEAGGEEQAGSSGGAGSGGAAAASTSAMTEAEAWQILGLEPGASAGEIKSAHRRLMRQFHPDQGGSAYFAAKLNQARDLLMGRRKG